MERYVAAVASETFKHSAVTDAPPHEVWEALDRPATWEAIPGIDRVTDPVLDSGGRLRGFSFETVAGGRRYRGVASPAERVEGQAIAWTVDSAEMQGTIRVGLTPVGGRTSVEVTVEVGSAGLLSSLFFPVIAGAIGRGLPGAVERFAKGLS